MNVIDLLQLQLREAHAFLEATMSDVTPELASHQPAGKANSVGVTYAHAVVAEDMLINGMLRQSPPLFATSDAGRTGLSEPMPSPGPEWARYADWTRTVQVALPALRQYAQAVYAASDQYLAGLSAEDLERPIDLSMVGMGNVTLGWMLSRLVIAHVDNECGEISAIKGVQGARGYPG